MQTRFFNTILLALLASLCAPLVASAQESAADFSRRDWMRQNPIGNLFGGPKASPNVARRPPPAQRRETRRQEAPPPAAAPAPPPQDFFSALFGPRPSYRSSSLDSQGDDRARITITPSLRGGSGDGERSGKSANSVSGSGTAAFCVRTCDGRYFPLQGRPQSANDPNAVAQCAAFCPAAHTEVFVSRGSEKGIDDAENKSGKSYSSMPNAFAFRQKLVEGCTCRTDGQVVGIGRIDAMEDPTLKRGDVIMTSDGARVFTGRRSRPPFRNEDFVAPERFPDLPRSMRQRIAELTVL